LQLASRKGENHTKITSSPNSYIFMEVCMVVGVNSYARDKLDNANIISTDIKSKSKPISRVLSWSRA